MIRNNILTDIGTITLTGLLLHEGRERYSEDGSFHDPDGVAIRVHSLNSGRFEEINSSGKPLFAVAFLRCLAKRREERNGSHDKTPGKVTQFFYKLSETPFGAAFVNTVFLS